MTELSNASEYSDVLQDAYVSGPVTVTTTQIEAKVGASRLSGREALTITNTSTTVVYYGPTGVTTTGAGMGDSLMKGQSVSMPIGDMGVFLRTASGSATVVVQEIA